MKVLKGPVGSYASLAVGCAAEEAARAMMTTALTIASLPLGWRPRSESIFLALRPSFSRLFK